MGTVAEVVADSIEQLEAREGELVVLIEAAKPELREIRVALRGLRKLAESNGGGARSGGAVDRAATNAEKDAVLRVLADGGARPSKIASEAGFDGGVARKALAELQESGDVETYGRGLWRLAE
jgi:hypothetical protein